jgi:hypothetical protein
MKLALAVLVTFGIGMAVALPTVVPGGCVDADCGPHDGPGTCCVVQPYFHLVPMLQATEVLSSE